jgi:uncharacterized protein
MPRRPSGPTSRSSRTPALVSGAARPEPLRTCVGCRRRAPQSELVRLVVGPDHGILVSRTAPGRGAWLCRGSLTCLERAVKRDAFRRAFRRSVTSDSVADLRDSFVRSPQNMEESSAAGFSPGVGDRQAKG